jgi:hypothetical protein
MRFAYAGPSGKGIWMSDGGCLCGRVRYSAPGEPESSLICHCVSCRRAAGAQSVAWVTFRAGGFSWVCGDPVEHRSSAEVSRTFCGTCGTSLTYQHDADPNFIDVSTASLDDPDEFPPTRHVWLEDAIGWEKRANDGLQRFERGTPPDWNPGS